MHRALVVWLAMLVPVCAHAQDRAPIQLNYAVYAAGLKVMAIESTLDLGQKGYRLDLSYHSTGLFGLVVHTEMQSFVQGTWTHLGATPLRFAAWGSMRGNQRRAVIDFIAGQPLVRELEPAHDEDRDPVPVNMRRDTIDTLGAIVALMRQVSSTGRCDGRVNTFDGRRLLELASRTAGTEGLETEDRSSFSGPALRCDVEGRQLAGFQPDDNAAERQKIHHSGVWLAQVLPGEPKLPVRVVFETRYFGHATAYLTAASAGAEPTRVARTAP
jgi:hypothetical protein